LSPAGATLLLSEQKLAEPPWLQLAFGVVLALSVLSFLVAAVLSIWVHMRPSPLRDAISLGKLPKSDAWVADETMHTVADEVVNRLPDSWQAAREKHSYAKLALCSLVVGLLFIGILTVLAVSAAVL
jgi:hypothetical protein